MELGHRRAGREHLIVESPIDLVHTDRSHVFHVGNDIWVKDSHLFILLIFFSDLLTRLASFDSFGAIVFRSALDIAADEVDIGHDFLISVCGVHIGLLQMGVNPFSSAELSQVQTEPFLNGTTEIQGVQNLGLAISALHIPQGEE